MTGGPFRRRAGYAAHARAGTPRARQAAVARAVRARYRARRKRLSDLAAPLRRAAVPGNAARPRSVDRRLFPETRRQGQAGRNGAEEPGAGGDAARGRRARRGCLLYRRHRRRHRRRGAGDQDATRRARARRPRRLQGGQARRRVPPVPRAPRLRHGTAFVGRDHHAGDPGPAGKIRYGRDRAELAAGRAFVRRGEPARLRRPRAVSRRPGLRRRADRRAARPRLSRRARQADRRHAQHGPGYRGRAARRHRLRAGRDDPGGRDQPYEHRRQRRQRGGDDHLHPDHVRLRRDGARLPAEQRADRFLLPPRPRRRAGRQRAGAGQAAAVVDGADAGLRSRAAGWSWWRDRRAAPGSSAMWRRR